jgi:hypothetical protein
MTHTKDEYHLSHPQQTLRPVIRYSYFVLKWKRHVSVEGQSYAYDKIGEVFHEKQGGNGEHDSSDGYQKNGPFHSLTVSATDAVNAISI